MSEEKYREVITNMLTGIHNTRLLKAIYNYVKYIYLRN